jgi:hypothetical protein
MLDHLKTRSLRKSRVVRKFWRHKPCSSDSDSDGSDSDTDAYEAWRFLCSDTDVSNLEEVLPHQPEFVRVEHIGENPVSLNQVRIDAFVNADNADLSVGDVVSAIEEEPIFFLEIASNDFWERIFSKIRTQQSLLYHEAILSGIAEAIPCEADRLAERTIRLLAEAWNQEPESDHAAKILARAFIPHLREVDEETLGVARHFAANEMENLVRGAFAEKTRAWAFFRGVREKNPKLLFDIVSPDWIEHLIDALIDIRSDFCDDEE